VRHLLSALNPPSVPLIDWLIVVGYLAAAVAVGLLVGRGNNSSEGFLLGRRNLSWWMLLLSIVATETSTVTFLSLPGKSFSDGGNFTFLQLAFGYIAGRMIVVWVLLPLYFSGQFFTAYEVLQKRFGRSVRLLASSIFLVMRTMSDGLRLLLTGLLIESATGLDFVPCVLLLAASTALYSAIGGVASVVLNDCLQFIAYMIGAAIALALLVWAVPGGAAGLWEFASTTGRLQLIDPSLSLTSSSITFFSGLIGGAALTMATHGADHMLVQRYLCARSRREAAWALGLSGPLVGLQFLLFLVIGVALAYYHSTTDVAYVVDRPDQAFIGYIVNELPWGLRGLVIASVLAASMSTLSSSLNASAGVLIKDLGSLLKREVSDAAAVFAARGATVVFAVLQSLVAIVAYKIALKSSVIDGALAIAGFSTGLLLGVYFLGLARGRASEVAGLIGIACGVACCSWVAFGTNVSWPWYSLVGSATTFGVGYLVSCIIPPTESPA